MKRKILIINGPNLCLLGKREPEIYGTKTLKEINKDLKKNFKSYFKLSFFTSNSEEKIINKIHKSRNYDAFVINLGAFSHTSLAISDALTAVKVPFVNVHISDISKREPYRQHDFNAKNAFINIIGEGTDGYKIALEKLKEKFSK